MISNYYKYNTLESNKKIVITFGTFDLFHKGHYNILKRASDLGEQLIVGVSSDWFNLTKKGVTTIDNLETRITNVKKLHFVDKVFSEESLEDKQKYINKYNANILVMGDDWKNKFDDLGIKTVYLKRTPNISSTLLKQINYKNYTNSLKKYLKLHGTYKIPLTLTSDIFPLKKYKFYNYEFWGPKTFKTMEDYYSKKCPMMTHAYAKWKKPPTPFKLNDFSPGNFNYGSNEFDFYGDNIYCTKNTKACVHTKNKYIGKDNNMSIRQCCRNHLNTILVDTCKFLEENKIPYFIYWGTLLGSIRHKGSIPWDTDNDIYILDHHYNKLIDILSNSELKNKYFLGKVNSNFIRVNYSKYNRAHLDIYIAEQFN